MRPATDGVPDETAPPATPRGRVAIRPATRGARRTIRSLRQPPRWQRAGAAGVAWALVVAWLLGRAGLAAAEPATVPTAAAGIPPVDPAVWPGAADHTVTWWLDGFPARVAGAPWLRCVQTGRYGFALDTARIRIPHLGPLAARVPADGPGYLATVRADNAAILALPPADVTISIDEGGTTYRCVAGAPWNQNAGPRLVEAGRFLARADVTGLVFESDDGRTLAAEARLDTICWPDRLALVLAVRPEASWRNASAAIRVAAGGSVHERRTELGPAGAEPAAWREVGIDFDPAATGAPPPVPPAIDTASIDAPPTVRAVALPDATALPVSVDPLRGWTRIDLDTVPQIVPRNAAQPAGAAAFDPRNDLLERVRLELTNPGPEPTVARLLFAKSGAGMRQGVGAPVTGITAVLRDRDGRPTGIPVQLSKNWHLRPEGAPHAGTWLHGFTVLRLPPRAAVDLELAIAYGHWGGLPAASHAQLSLLGWGSNQQWDEAAIGAWGETICFEPDQVQGECSILDVRPLLVASMDGGRPWGWTHNVGGGDFLRVFDPAGRRLPHARMKTAYERHGPCLTEVTYAGRIGAAIEHAATTSLARGDDVVRATCRVRMEVREPLAFSRLVLFQIGADTYSYTGERKMAVGDETGLQREWSTQWGGGGYRTEPLECRGRVPWVSLHEAVSRRGDRAGGWADRGLVIRSWTARLGGRDARPWIAEHGVVARGTATSTIDIVPPPGVDRLLPGDALDATFEIVVVPQSAADYYGTNAALRAALAEMADTWRMIHREARGGDRRVDVRRGRLVHLHPDVRIEAAGGDAAFSIAGGTGHVPVTITGLGSYRGGRLLVDGTPVDQAVHGNDFWQTDHDPRGRTWSHSYNVPLAEGVVHDVRFASGP